MREDERMLINWPTTRKVMIEQLKRAMKMYGAYKLSNEELMYFVENYMNNFGHLSLDNTKSRTTFFPVFYASHP